MFKTNVSERNSHKFEVIYYRGFISLKVRKPLHVANSFSINFTSIRPLNFALCATKLYLTVIRKQANLSRECSRFDLKLMHTHREKERNGEETRACTIRARVYFIFARAGARQYFLYHIKKKKAKSRSVDDSYLWNSTRRTRDYYHTAQKQLQHTLLQSQ